MRTFETGATRDTDDGKLDYEGFLSPLVLERFARYMHTKRELPAGTLRDADNWQRGIPRDAYMKSAWRHFFDFWSHHRGWPAKDTLEEAICALLFNVMGYLHELLASRLDRRVPVDPIQDAARYRVLERIAAARAGKPVPERSLTELDD